MDTLTKILHGQFVGAFVDVYEGQSAIGLLHDSIIGIIGEARSSMKPSEFAKFVVAEFGTGGRPSAEGYDAGRLPTALRAKGIMSTGAKRREGDASDAARVNGLVSRTRVIAFAAAKRPTFDLDRSFSACYHNAKGAGSGSNASKAAKPSKTNTKPSKAAVITLDSVTPQLAQQWIEAHLATACECIVNVLRARKDAIRMAQMESIRAGLVAAK